MLIKVVCQICGRTKTVNTKEAIGKKPRWENYKISDFGIENEPFSDYEIWICPECHSKTIEDWDMGYPNYDWDKLTEMVKESLFEKEQNQKP